MPLHLLYRPNSFDEFIGNKSTVESLKSVLEREDRPRSFLLIGSTGCGKTTLARLIAKTLNCSDIEFHEYNAANTRGIDTIREIIKNSLYVPIEGELKVYLLDECHSISGAAAEALLKFLEDTPSHVIIILCTTVPEKLIPTIRNRCTTFVVSTLNNREMNTLLNWVLKSENVVLSEEVTDQIIESAEGCPRKALVILDKIIDLPPEKQINAAMESSIDDVTTLEICRLLINSESKSWGTMTQLLKSCNSDPETIRKAVLGYLASTLTNTGARRYSEMIQLFSSPFFDSGKAGLFRAFFVACSL